MVDSGGSSEMSGCVKIFTTTLISFIYYNVSLLSNAALSVVMKQLNKTSSDCWHSRCVDVE